MSHQKFIEADGENLPFDKHEFDYSICCHVLEHAEDPTQFLKEQMRVSKRGYIETPSLIGEYLFPKQSHKWLILEVDGVLVMYDKEEIGFTPSNDFGALFLDYLPQKSLAYKIFLDSYPDVHTIRQEWEHDIDFLINPPDPHLKELFTKPWNNSTVHKFIPDRSEAREVFNFVKSTLSVFKTIVLNRLG